MDVKDITLKSRTATYFTLFGIVIGLLVGALVIPLVFGDRVSTTASGTTNTTFSFPDDDDTGTPTDGAAEDGVAEAPGRAGTSATSNPLTNVANTLPPGVTLTASDRGVTATTIKVGLLLFDVGGASQFGFTFPGVDPAAQKEAWEAFVADLNARGGILGRKILPVYATYDVLSPDSMRAACLTLTKDEKVFAAIDQGGIAGPSVLCFTEENRTLFFNLSGFGLPQDMYARSDGLLFTLFPSGLRSLKNFSSELIRQNLLKDRTIGILADDFPDNVATIDDGVVQILRDKGFKIAHRENLSSDLSTGASQIPLAVQRMRSAGVDTVMLLTQSLYATQFVSQSSSAGWTYRYLLGDWWGGYSDTYGENMPEAFNGAIAITTSRNGEWRKNLPEPEPEKQCRLVFEKHTRKELDRKTIAYASTVRQCAQLGVLERAARNVGADLTMAKTSAAIQGLGSVPMPHFGGGSFGRGKFDFGDLVRTTQWHSDIGGYVPVDDFHRPAY